MLFLLGVAILDFTTLILITTQHLYAHPNQYSSYRLEHTEQLFATFSKRSFGIVE